MLLTITIKDRMNTRISLLMMSCFVVANVSAMRTQEFYVKPGLYMFTGGYEPKGPNDLCRGVVRIPGPVGRTFVTEQAAAAEAPVRTQSPAEVAATTALQHLSLAKK
jgi:hypothetical protein